MISEQHPPRIPADGSGEGIGAWFAREAPGIVAGLEASQFIGPLTAATAWDLIASGRHADAVHLVLGEVDESWKHRP